MLVSSPLKAESGVDLAFGAAFVMSFDEAMSIPREEWIDVLYERKFILIRGMRNLTQDQFWRFCSRFGDRAWNYEDYEVSGENRIYIDDNKTKAITIYDNIYYKKALGDGEMSWHVDVPLWRTHDHPIRCFYATSIPDNKHGITRFADRAWIPAHISAQEREELSHWQVLYHSWYKPYTSLTYLPAVAKHQHTKQEYINFTSFNNSLEEYSHDFYGWKVHGWIIGAKRDGVPYNADIISRFHKQTLVPDNIYNHAWIEQDFIIYSNLNMIHARTSLKSHLNPTKPRSFFRMNVFNYWQAK